jgi:hypothetical protein
MSYLLTLGKKLHRSAVPSFPPMPLAPAPVRAPAPVVETVVVPVYVQPEPESLGASPIPDAELIPVASEEQYASPPAPASTTSSHTESSSE